MKAFILLAALACSGAALATALPIRGILLDAASRQPIEYATVSAYADSLLVDGTVTDAEGSFALELERGDYRLVFEFLGYASLDTMVAVTGAIDLGMLYLGTEGVNLESVEVRAERSQMELSLDKKVFNVGKDALARGGSANQVLEQLPSVNVTPEGQISLRGNAGVRVLINGRPSALANNNALDAIPAENIERVEIITNPSARYEAAGTAGIINIILKQNADRGYGGTASLSTGYRADHRLGLNLNLRRPKWNAFLNGGGRYSNYLGTTDIQRRVRTGDGPLTVDNDLEMRRHDRAGNLYTGLDYRFTDAATLTASYALYHVLNEDDYTNDYNLSGPGAAERWSQDLQYREPGTYHQLDLALAGAAGEEGKYAVYLKHDRWNELETEDTRLRTLLPDEGLRLDYRTRSRESSADYLVQGDYERQLSETGKLEAGVRGESRVIRSAYLALDRRFDPPSIIAGFDNEFDYFERIGSAYAQYGRKGEPLGYQLGLRYEYTDIATENRDEGQVDIDKDYHRLFPSASLSYRMSEATRWQLSYSRRIQRPQFWQLSPFAGITDPTRLRVGNPDMDPAYTDRLELNFLYQQEKITVNPAVYASRTVDELFTIFRQQDENPFGLPGGTLVGRPVNLDHQDNYGIELTTSYRPGKWLTLNTETNFLGYRQRGTVEGVNLDFARYSWSAGLRPQVSLPADWEVQINLFYQAPFRTVQESTLASYVTDVALTKTWTERWQLSLNLRSPRFRKWEIETEDSFQSEHFIWTQWRTGLTLTYRFEKGADAGERRQRGSIR